MSELNDCRRLSVMMWVADSARADIALTSERIYYRFATDDSIEDGELPPSKVDFGQLADKLVRELSAKENERPLSSEVKVTVFVDNRLTAVEVSEESLRRFVGEMRCIAEEFAFLGGFC